MGECDLYNSQYRRRSTLVRICKLMERVTSRHPCDSFRSTARWRLLIIRTKSKQHSTSNRTRGHRKNCIRSKVTSRTLSKFPSCFDGRNWHDLFYYSKRKVRGLYGHWTDAFYAIDIEHFESFLKQHKKDVKHAARQSQGRGASSASSADQGDPDEEVPDVDVSSEQLNLPPNSLTLWRILPKLEYADQVNSDTCEPCIAIVLLLSITISIYSPWR